MKNEKDFILDDSINDDSQIPTEDYLLARISFVLKKFPIEKQEETLRGFMNSKARFPKEYKEVLIKYKYFDENEKYIYKPQ